MDVLEQRLNALEGGVAALAVSSGAAAVSMSSSSASAGDNLVSAPQLYGATYTLFAHVLPRTGIEVRFAVDDQPESLAARSIAVRRLCSASRSVIPPATLSTSAVAGVAHSHGVPVIVDNTVATPILLKPFEHGADVVVHSLTKFVGGHGTTLGGLSSTGGFPVGEHPERFRCLLDRTGLPRSPLHP